MDLSIPVYKVWSIRTPGIAIRWPLFLAKRRLAIQIPAYCPARSDYRGAGHEAGLASPECRAQRPGLPELAGALRRLPAAGLGKDPEAE